MCNSLKTMRVLELFSGIGGMHYALEGAGVEAEVVAVDINPVANNVYRHNFPSSRLVQKNILSLNAEEVNKFLPEILLMSPPCQPFTRVGLKKDLDDARTDPLKHILSLLPDLPTLSYILVENVKGFENSEARNKLKTCIEDLHFNVQEFLISPSQMGVPNVRTRYYLLAKRTLHQFSFKTGGILDELPKEAESLLDGIEDKFPAVTSVADILETKDTTSRLFQEHLIPDKLVEKRAWVMDIVSEQSGKTCCFTKAYGHYAEGTGSVFCPHDQTTIDRVFTGSTRESMDLDALSSLKLRYFTAREVARLMSFPEHFTFPAGTTKKQKYRLLGNSINVKLVALLIALMFHEPQR